jgi:hypothetical protein
MSVAEMILEPDRLQGRRNERQKTRRRNNRRTEAAEHRAGGQLQADVADIGQGPVEVSHCHLNYFALQSTRYCHALASTRCPCITVACAMFLTE